MTSVRLTTCGPPVQTERFSLCCLNEDVSVADTVFISIISKRSSDVSFNEITAGLSDDGSLLWTTGSIGTYKSSLTGSKVQNFSITSLNSSDTLQHHGGETWECGFYRYYRNEHVSQYTIPQTRNHFYIFKCKPIAVSMISFLMLVKNYLQLIFVYSRRYALSNI